MAIHAKASSTSSTPDQRTFVLDTSVLLSDPHAMLRFDEHEVVVPVVVVTELEAKRHHPELGYFARTALRLLDELGSCTDVWTRPCQWGRRVELSGSS